MCKFGFVGVIADDKRLSQYYKSAQSCRDGYHPPVRFVLFYWHAPCKSYHERRRATPPQSQLTPSRLLLQGRLIDSATNPNLPISQRYILNNTSLATHQYKAKNPTQRKTVGRISISRSPASYGEFYITARLSSRAGRHRTRGHYD